MKITLKDIAQDTGLSISTVSRALSGNGKISTENERKIFESAQRLNYPLNHITTPLSLKKNLYVALITKFHTGEFYASFYDGFDRAAKQANLNFGLFNVPDDMSEIDFMKDLWRDRFDAAVIFLPTFNELEYRKILAELPLDFPIISTAPIATTVMDTVTFDNYRGGYLVGKHFIERGYESFGIVTGPNIKTEALLRKSGFQDGLSPIREKLIWQYNGDYSHESGGEAFKEFKSLSEKPRAIFISNDAMAVSFMQNAQSDGFSIPNDVAIASYDDLPLCEFLHPTLTSVHTNFKALGDSILALLMSRLEHTTPHRGIMNLIPVTLTVRNSS